MTANQSAQPTIRLQATPGLRLGSQSSIIGSGVPESERSFGQ